MRIAVLADIHGNLVAFEAALKDVRTQGVDQIVLAGDIVVGASDSAQCWELATSLGCPMIRGNHERYVYDFRSPTAPAEWSGQRYLPVAWAYERTTADQRAAMAALPMRYSPPDRERELMIVHASLRGDYDTINGRTTNAEFAAMFPGDPPSLILRAHNHIARTQQWGDRTVVTSGSVGLPLDHETTVQYVIATRTSAGVWTIEHRSVQYDHAAALRRFHDTGYLAATGPMGYLFYREVATASYQLLPFLRWYNRWQAEGPITLDEALDRFLHRL